MRKGKDATLTVQEAARASGIEQETLRQWIRTSRFGTTLGQRLGRHYVVDMSELSRIVEREFA